MSSMEDRISTNVGAATLVAEPTPGKAGEMSLFIEDAAGRNPAKRKLGAFIDVADGIIGAAEGEVFGSAVDADAWLSNALKCATARPGEAAALKQSGH